MSNRFTDIKNKDLRVWNRCAMIFNIMKDKDTEAAAKYAKTFTLEERNEIANMYERIRKNGYEATRAEVNRTVQVGTIAV